MLKFLCKLVNLTRSYKRKQGDVFFWTQCIWHGVSIAKLDLSVPFSAYNGQSSGYLQFSAAHLILFREAASVSLRETQILHVVTIRKIFIKSEPEDFLCSFELILTFVDDISQFNAFSCCKFVYPTSITKLTKCEILYITLGIWCLLKLWYHTSCLISNAPRWIIRMK